jgi:Kelch motif
MCPGGQSGEDMQYMGGAGHGGHNPAMTTGISRGQITPQIKNHTATLYNKKLYVFGGYDGKKNHSNLRIYDTETL